MSHPTFTVMAHSDLIDELDSVLRPMDGLMVIDHPYLELPLLHPGRLPKRRSQRAPGTLRVFRARYDWVGIGFSYVQLGSTLHVIEFWGDSVSDTAGRTDLDIVIGTNPDDWETTPCSPEEIAAVILSHSKS